MGEEGPPGIPANRISEIAVVKPSPAAFPGFKSDAFGILDRLREEPHLETYRREKKSVESLIQAPFRLYRDDVVAGFVLPNHLDLETERNVFSRILKNDFGRGGTHHHYWMSFYRPGRSRLRDLQFIHSLHPDTFRIGISASTVGASMLRHVKKRIAAEPAAFANLVLPAIASTGAMLRLTVGAETLTIDDLPTLSDWLPQLQKATAIRLMRAIPKQEVLELEAGLVGVALDVVRDLWPVYHFLIRGE